MIRLCQKSKIIHCSLGRINTEAIDVVGLDQRLNPLRVAGNNGRILGVDIWKRHFGITEPAVLLAGVVAPLDGTVRVIL